MFSQLEEPFCPKHNFMGNLLQKHQINIRHSSNHAVSNLIIIIIICTFSAISILLFCVDTTKAPNSQYLSFLRLVAYSSSVFLKSLGKLTYFYFLLKVLPLSFKCWQ